MRMLALVGMLIIVVIGMRLAARPQSWYWLTGEPTKSESGESTSASDTDEQIDFRIRIDDPESLPPGVFRSELPHPEDSDQSGDQNESATAIETDDSDPPDETSHTAEMITIDTRLLDDVKDNTLGIRRSESDAYFAVLAHVRDSDPTALRQAAQEDLAFKVLMLDSERLRGEVVTVEGVLRRFASLPAVANDYGISESYEAWMFTSDSGNNPYRIVFSEHPGDLSFGEFSNGQVRVRATGYFFKRYGYATQDGMHAAPLILAKTISRVHAPASMAEETGLAGYVAGLLILMIGGFSLMIWRFRASDRKFHRSDLKRWTAASAEEREALNSLEATDIREQLEQLADESSTSHDQ